MKRPVIILLHAGYWLLFLLLLFLFFLLVAQTAPKFPENEVFGELGDWIRVMIGFAIVPGLMGFYTSYFFLFPKFLARKKIGLFFLFGLMTGGTGGLLGLSMISLMIGQNLFAEDAAGPMTVIIGFGVMMNGIVGTVMRGFISWYGDIRLKEELSRKNHETELALVRSQLSPHFLFNTINNIDVLIMKDPAKASAYLNGLSDIMRFMLYGSKAEQISLAEELAYIEKYLALQKIRSANENYVQYAVEGDAAGWMIAPMLFIPFIENAFKHAEAKKAENAIHIRIVIEAQRLTFACSNRYSETAQPAKAGGLGNELIRKRLQLLYPGRHTLSAAKNAQQYEVYLVIERA